MGIGENIRRIRKQRGMTQGDLAEKIGVTKSAICHWELGNVTNIQLENISAMASAFGCTTGDILGTDYSATDSVKQKLHDIINLLTEEDAEAFLRLLTR